jgi:predicted DNA-binding protein
MAPALTTSLRLPQELLDRADALIPLLGKHASAQASGELVRSDVLRLALSRGLDALESEHPSAKSSRATRKR